MHGIFAGWHLTYDAIVDHEHVGNLVDLGFLERVLWDLVELMEMEMLDEPKLYRIEFDPSKLETDEDEGGIVGTASISTSHISIHTWPLRERFSMDVFSCREFSDDDVQDFLRERFNVKRRSSHWIKRLWP
jgi:S-adenosylmethionine/arginine decarboxylase-like enzyme